MDIKEYFIEYIKAKDAFQKKIIEISLERNLIKYDDKEVFFYVEPSLEQIKNLDPKNHYYFLYSNKKSNLNNLLNNWDTLKKYPNLTVMFINSDSQTETKWIVKPFIHDKITEPEALKLGLTAMFETVEEVK